MALKKPDSSLFFSRQDSQDPRWGEIVQQEQPADIAAHVQLFGWPDDEGIHLNGGRPGAAEAPDRIRKFLYKMTPSLTEKALPSLWDRGNLAMTEGLEFRHEFARKQTLAAYRQGSPVLTFGGGHDYGFPDTAAFVEAHLKERPVVINFDAHMDVRPADKSFHSGTPFRRLLEKFPQSFDFLEVGLQPQCNSRAHRDWLIKQGGEIWMASDVATAEQMKSQIETFCHSGRHQRPLFVSLDIDALTSSAAPGCSQSWETGLKAERIFEALEMLDRHFVWKGLGIYEVSPALDHDDRTSKLASLFAFDFVTRRSRT